MPMHMIAYETSASEAALTAITPVPDPTLRIAGNDFFTPPSLNSIVLAGMMINSAAATLRGQIQAPSLRATLNFDMSPINNGLVFSSPAGLNRIWNSPLNVQPNEPLDVFAQNGANVMNRAILMIADKSPTPVSGKIYTVRGTLAATLVTATWVNSAITFGQTLPAGHYQIVGLSVVSTNGVACRVFPVGAFWRPGVPVRNTDAAVEWPEFRAGGIGVLGEFDNTTPPTFDVLGVTDTAQIVYLDLIKTA